MTMGACVAGWLLLMLIGVAVGPGAYQVGAGVVVLLLLALLVAAVVQFIRLRPRQPAIERATEREPVRR